MSSTLSRSVRPWSCTLAGAAALVLLTACGGDGGSGGSAAGSSTAESEAAGSSAAGGSDEFCTQAADIDKRVESALSDLEGDDPSVADAFQQVSEELRGIEPPEAIASDWEALAGGLDRMAAAFADFDITDPDSLAALEAAEGDLTSASDNVETYLRDECGIEP
jgi:hypothetical protein